MEYTMIRALEKSPVWKIHLATTSVRCPRAYYNIPQENAHILEYIQHDNTLQSWLINLNEASGNYTAGQAMGKFWANG